jgi:hypothetical protein
LQGHILRIAENRREHNYQRPIVNVSSHTNNNSSMRRRRREEVFKRSGFPSSSLALFVLQQKMLLSCFRLIVPLWLASQFDNPIPMCWSLEG